MKKLALLFVLTLGAFAMGQREILRDPEIKRTDTLAVVRIIVDYGATGPNSIGVRMLRAEIAAGSITATATGHQFVMDGSSELIEVPLSNGAARPLEQLAEQAIKRYCRDSGRCAGVF